ncbi:MAG: hypothetical protein JWR52_2004 [Marmoricola sp.]|nr:hypothetical protein [Marmoricola sp.]
MPRLSRRTIAGVGARRKKGEADVVRITAAPDNPNEDIDRRQRRYLISMGIRTLCFVGSVFTVHIPWLCGTLIAASFVLPYIAVVLANAAAPRIEGSVLGPGVAPRPDYGELGGPTKP